tara:strand:+ start:172 stop:438 length:267 start_codon:yes stop_codon:yes gene_type:complete
MDEMQTITTKYLGPTDHRGSRYKATHTGGYKTVTINSDFAVDADVNHTNAANELATKLGWEGDYIGGHTKDGMVFVNAAPMYKFSVPV